jgi:biofilm protein TabA
LIADRLDHLERYRGLHPRLDRGLEALRRLASESAASRAHAPADGRHELEGEELYGSLSTYVTGEAAGRSYEAHRRYIDIQAVLSGRELLYWAPLAGLAVRRAYLEAEDVAFFEDPPGGGAGLLLELGVFTVLFPQDAHKPGCWAAAIAGSGGSAGSAGGAGRGGLVRKLVLKVRM